MPTSIPISIPMPMPMPMPIVHIVNTFRPSHPSLGLESGKVPAVRMALSALPSGPLAAASIDLRSVSQRYLVRTVARSAQSMFNPSHGQTVDVFSGQHRFGKARRRQGCLSDIGGESNDE